MLFSATLLALVLGTAVSAPWYGQRHGGSARHQMGLNPLWQGRSSLTQGFLCDWCVVGVEDAQLAIKANLNQILDILNRTSQICAYCPVEDQCSDYFLNEIPQEIQNFLAETPSDLCNEAGVCDENATLPGMVMNNLNGNVARDRVIKRMLMRSRVMQQKMIRLILGPDYLCTACQDFVATSREMLLDNETQYEVVNFLTPMCDYMPTEYQTECTEFVQSLPALMTMFAIEVLVDSTCAELGFCNQTKDAPGLPDVDIFSHLGLPGVLPVMVNGQNPFQFPSGNPNTGSNRQNPFSFPGKTPFGSQTIPGQNPFRFPSHASQTPFGLPSRPGETQYPGRSRPEYPTKTRPGQYPGQFRPQHPSFGKWPTSTNPRPSVVRPQKPKPSTPKPVDREVPGFNLEDIFGETAGVLDSLPSMPDLSLPRLPISIPGWNQGRSPSKRIRGQGRRIRSLADWADIEKFVPKDNEYQYIPDPIPGAGIIITEQGADENCEVCKLAVTAVDTWLQKNAPELQKMIAQAAQPFCEMFPSPMKEDCVSDVSEFVQTFIKTLVSQLQPEPVCTWLGVCNAKAEDPVLTTVGVPATENPPLDPEIEFRKRFVAAWNKH